MSKKLPGAKRRYGWLWVVALFALCAVACSNSNDSKSSLQISDSSARAIFLDSVGKDHRQAMDVTKYPWSAIGRLSSPQGWLHAELCTATMVGRTIAVTAAHCVVKDGRKTKVVFKAGYFHDHYVAKATSINIEVGTTEFLDVDHATEQEVAKDRVNWPNDWAVIQLDQPLGDKIGFMDVQFLGVINSNVAVKYAGYSNNFDHNESAGVDPSCSLRDSFAGGTYGHSCSMGPGGSGGPLFTTDEQGQAHIVAINTRGVTGGIYNTYNTENANVAVMNQKFLDSINQYKQLYDSPGAP